MTASQDRQPLSDAVQQHAAAAASSLVSLQIETHSAAGSFSAEKDFAACDASVGAFDLALPAADQAIVGKPYIVKEVEGTNAVTVTTPGDETIDGGADFEVAPQTSACFVFDGVSWHSIANAGSGGAGFLVDGAGTVDSDNLAAGSVDPVHLSSGYRVVAEDGALTLAATDRTIELAGSTAAPIAATMTATHAGHRVTVMLRATGGDDYTLAASGQTVTLTAAGDGVELCYDGAAWQWVALFGAAAAA